MNNLNDKKRAIGLIHKVYLAYLKNNRTYTASTKTKAEVAGGGRKPWKQKGTGQARAGSIRSPLWVGGGVIFGPKPRVTVKKINKKEKKLAIRSALFLKQSDFIFISDNILEELSFSKKTKVIHEFLLTLNITTKSTTLLLLTKPNPLLKLITRNLKNVELCLINSLNIQLLLKANKIILSKDSLNLLNEFYGKF
jgi:large subunit ribosomal protein L4